MRKSLKKVLASCVGAAVLASQANADIYHYNNIIAGDRAMGMGGAYGGVSDDASGVIYNPAGLGFALSNDISGSANAFYRRRVEYKKVVAGGSFVENSEGFFNPFFGGLQKLDHIYPGLVVAGGMYTTDAELKDQNTLLENVIASDTYVARFHRTANVQSATNFVAGAVALRVGGSVSIGAGVNFLRSSELSQIYQDSIFLTQAPRKDPTTGIETNVTGYIVQTRNVREKLDVSGLQPVLGIQAVLGGKFSLGFTIKHAMLIKDNLEFNFEDGAVFADSPNSGGKPIDLNQDDENTRGGYTKPPYTGEISRVVSSTNYDGILGGWPMEARFGMAWFANPRFLWTLDASYHSAVEAKLARFDREAVLNLSTGAEVYLTPSFPLRLGLFTNNDARPEVTASTANGEHIDYLGASVFLAWAQPNSQVALGTVLQHGAGQAQKLGDKAIQDVEAMAVTVGLSASHNF